MTLESRMLTMSGPGAIAFLPDGSAVPLRARSGHLLGHVDTRTAVNLIHACLVEAVISRKPRLKYLRVIVDDQEEVFRLIRHREEGERLISSRAGCIAEDSRLIFSDGTNSSDPGIFTYTHTRNFTYHPEIRAITGFRSDATRPPRPRRPFSISRWRNALHPPQKPKTKRPTEEN